MQLAILAGVHATSFSLLQQCVELNSRQYLRSGTFVTKYDNYKHYLNDVLDQQLEELGGVEFDWTAILGSETNARYKYRMIVSSEGFFGTPRLAAREARFYHRANDRVGALVQLVPDAEIEFIVLVRNPATFLPALFDKTSVATFKRFIGDADPREYSWFKMFSELSENYQNINFSVFCYEDLPLSWGELLRVIGSLDPTAEVRGEYAFAWNLMNATGHRRMKSYLKSSPGLSELQKRRVAAAFLDKYIQVDKLEQVISIPNWTEDFIHELTQQYEDDLLRLSRLPNVSLTSI